MGKSLVLRGAQAERRSASQLSDYRLPLRGRPFPPVRGLRLRSQGRPVAPIRGKLRLILRSPRAAEGVPTANQGRRLRTVVRFGVQLRLFTRSRESPGFSDNAIRGFPGSISAWLQPDRRAVERGPCWLVENAFNWVRPCEISRCSASCAMRSKSKAALSI